MEEEYALTGSGKGDRMNKETKTGEMKMKLEEMISRRKSVRSYTGVPVEKSVQEKIRGFMENVSALYPEIRFRYEIVARERIRSIMPWLPPQVIAIYSEEKEGYLENAGFVFQQLDLYLQSIGLGSCWVGLGKTADGKDRDGMGFVILLAFGYPKGDALRSGAGEFKRKSLAEISDRTDERLEPARLAPSSVNSQPWYFTHDGEKIHVYGARKSLFSGLVLSDMNRIDIGIALAHLYVSNPETFRFSKDSITETEKGRSYIGSIRI
jgi:nitroreductase